MGEMLQDGGNRWRGMLYGMTSRMSYQGNNPSPIWKVWDDFKIQDSEMFGYWSSRCPVKTDHQDVLATAYVGRNKTPGLAWQLGGGRCPGPAVRGLAGLGN